MEITRRGLKREVGNMEVLIVLSLWKNGATELEGSREKRRMEVSVGLRKTGVFVGIEGRLKMGCLKTSSKNIKFVPGEVG